MRRSISVSFPSYIFRGLLTLAIRIKSTNLFLHQVRRSRLPASAALVSAGFVAVASGADIYLEWDSNSERDLAGYHVYRSLTPGTGYVRANRALLSSNKYLDDSLESERVFYYVVTAVNRQGLESAFSQELKVYSGSEDPDENDVEGPIVEDVLDDDEFDDSVVDGGQDPVANDAPGGQLLIPLRLESEGGEFAQGFIATALVNVSREQNFPRFSLLDSEGNELGNGLGNPLQPQGQSVFSTIEFDRPEFASLLVAQGALGPLSGAFWAGDAERGRLAGLWADADASTRLFLPLSEVRPQEGDTLVFIANPSLDQDCRVRLSLHLASGQAFNEIILNLAGGGSISDSISSLFPGADGPGYLQASSDLPLQGFALETRGGDYASLPARSATPVRRLFAPQYRVDPQGGDSEILLLNLEQVPVRAMLKAFDQDGNIRAARLLDLPPRSLFVKRLSAYVVPWGGQGVQGHLRVELGETPRKVLGSVTIIGAKGALASEEMGSRGFEESLIPRLASADHDEISSQLSILNLGSEQAEAVVQLFNERGRLELQRVIYIEAGGLSSRSLFDLFGWQAASIRGHLRIESESPLVSLLSLANREGGFLATLCGRSAVPAQEP